MNKPVPLSVFNAARYFSNPQTCDRLMRQLRWPGGFILCPRCKGGNISSISTRNIHHCKTCRKQFSLKAGTLLEDSPLELGQWFLALFVLIHASEMTCAQLAHLLGVTLRTAWDIRRKLIRATCGIDKKGSFKNILAQVLQLPKLCVK
jgi:transposase-like protein